MIILLFILSQDINFEDLCNKATTSLVKFKVDKDSAFNKLIELGKDSVYADTTINFLVSKFDTKSALERHTLKDIFKKIGESTIRGIVEKIDYRGSDDEDRSLKQSLWVLGEIGGEKIVEPAARFINDEKWQIRSNAYTALGKSKSQNALNSVLQGLNDPIPIVRKSAYFALSQIASENEISYLVQGLDDVFYGVRYAAVDGLVSVGEKALDTLISMIGHSGLKDYGIFAVLLQFDIENDRMLKFVKHKEPSIRLLLYEGLDDKIILKMCLEFEGNSFLKNYLSKKLSGAR